MTTAEGAAHLTRSGESIMNTRRGTLLCMALLALDAVLLGPVVGGSLVKTPAQIRKMGGPLASLPPRDMLLALYQLWVDNGEESEPGR
jgi:hypothetical protein